MTENLPQEFDEYAADYDEALAHGLRISGEDKNYFAKSRINWLADCLKQLNSHPRSIMDLGCGTGSAEPFLLALKGVESVLGIDASPKSLAIAKQNCGDERAKFLLSSQYRPSGQLDLVFCNGVFHHIPPDKRPEVVRYAHSSLRPGGLLALWENNPCNPGARYVMSRIPFDRDAIMLMAGKARRMLEAEGFTIVRTDLLESAIFLAAGFGVFDFPTHALLGVPCRASDQLCDLSIRIRLL